MSWEIRQGDALERLREMPDESVQCCVTSPPYFGLRDYGVAGQLGLEATPAEFVVAMVGLFAEVRRVLRDDGTLWLNVGDSYAGSRGAQSRGNRTGGLKPKDLTGIPWMLAFALRADGWYLRRDIIWSKPNPMPESVTDRPTSSHEYLFLLSKSARYFYDAEAIREQGIWAGQSRSERGPRESPMPGAPPHVGLRQEKQRGHGWRHDGFNDRWDAMSKDEQQALGRNKRSVWTIATRPYPDAHFATFPPDLVEPCILAGTPEKACGECGAPWRRVTERVDTGQRQKMADGWDTGEGGHGSIHRSGREQGESGVSVMTMMTVGFEATCECEAEPVAASVLDPFAGASTTGLVATRHNRDFIGIELNPKYVELGRNRIRDDAPLLNVPAESLETAQPPESSKAA